MKYRTKIDVLSSANQSMNKSRFILGLDTELLPVQGKSILWPHKEKCPQERGNSQWSAEIADWHGDGYAFELNVDPESCVELVIRNVGTGFGKFIMKYPGKPLAVHTPTVYSIPARIVASAPDEVKRLGCMPSFNVYDNEGCPESLSKTQRTTGCHLHISHSDLDNDKAKTSVKWADILVGNTWNFICPGDPKIEAERRQAYGRAGEHRRNIYPNGRFGFEYRVLPGSVLRHPVYLSLMFNLLRTAVTMAFKHGDPDMLMQRASMVAINTADRDLSAAVMRELQFTPDSLKLIHHLRANPLVPFTMRDWSATGNFFTRTGHKTYFQDVV